MGTPVGKITFSLLKINVSFSFSSSLGAPNFPLPPLCLRLFLVESLSLASIYLAFSFKYVVVVVCCQRKFEYTFKYETCFVKL